MEDWGDQDFDVSVSWVESKGSRTIHSSAGAAKLVDRLSDQRKLCLKTTQKDGSLTSHESSTLAAHGYGVC